MVHTLPFESSSVCWLSRERRRERLKRIRNREGTEATVRFNALNFPAGHILHRNPQYFYALTWPRRRANWQSGRQWQPHAPLRRGSFCFTVTPVRGSTGRECFPWEDCARRTELTTTALFNSFFFSFNGHIEYLSLIFLFSLSVSVSVCLCLCCLSVSVCLSLSFSISLFPFSYISDGCRSSDGMIVTLPVRILSVACVYFLIFHANPRWSTVTAENYRPLCWKARALNVPSFR